MMTIPDITNQKIILETNEHMKFWYPNLLTIIFVILRRPNWLKFYIKPPKTIILKTHPTPLYRSWGLSSKNTWKTEWANKYFLTKALVKNYPEEICYKRYIKHIEYLVKELEIFD